eukprot:TRINITY_DN13934_c0_g1_i1.p1 TRINITY_DN13934_c0_g1~~TRINITY_DN13934_c0_g1_i1.p1  ORF type:complete len:756 (+),score=196.11 TRINITY_DN13934_c0_g1_i1:315-2270(+)
MAVADPLGLADGRRCAFPPAPAVRVRQTDLAARQLLLPAVVRALLSESGGGPVEMRAATDGRLPAPLPDDATTWLNKHRGHLAPMLQQCVSALAVLRPAKPVAALRRLAVRVAHPTAASAAHFPSLTHVTDELAVASPSGAAADPCWGAALATALESWPHTAEAQRESGQVVYRQMLAAYISPIVRAVEKLSTAEWPGGSTTLTLCTDEAVWRRETRTIRQQAALAAVACTAAAPHHLHFQPTVTVEYLGVLAVVRGSVGSPSQCVTVCGPGNDPAQSALVLKIVAHLHTTLAKVASALNLKGIVPTDVSVVRGADGRLYVTNCRLGPLPCDSEPLVGLNVNAQHSVLHPGVLRRLQKKIDPYALRQRDKEAGESVREALCAAVASFCRNWRVSALWDRPATREVLNSGNWSALLRLLKRRMHDHGLGLCHLGQVVAHQAASLRGSAQRQTVLVEIAARTFRWLLRYELRRVVGSAPSDEARERQLLLVAGDMFALLLSPTRGDAREFWRDRLAPEVEWRFAHRRIDTELVPRIPLFYRASELCGAVFSADARERVRQGCTLEHLACAALRPVVKALMPPPVSAMLAQCTAAPPALVSSAAAVSAPPVRAVKKLNRKVRTQTSESGTLSASDDIVIAQLHRQLSLGVTALP